MACTLAASPSDPSTPKAPTASLPSPPFGLLPGGAERVPGWQLHPLKSSAFHGALFRQLARKGLGGRNREATRNPSQAPDRKDCLGQDTSRTSCWSTRRLLKIIV